MSLCPCGSGRPYEECCETYIEGRETAPTAEALMRSRYAAHTLGKYDYLNETVHPSIRDEADHEDMKKWSEAVEWEGLEIFSTKDGAETDETGEVSFEARYSVNGMPQSLREDAFFRREDGRWYYVDGNVHQLSRTWFGPGRFPGIETEDFSEQSLYGCLEEKYGVSIAQQDLSVSLRVPSRDEARTLGITDRQPRLSLQITAYSSDGEPFLYGESVFVSTDAHIYFTAGGYRSENP